MISHVLRGGGLELVFGRGSWRVPPLTELDRTLPQVRRRVFIRYHRGSWGAARFTTSQFVHFANLDSASGTENI